MSHTRCRLTAAMVTAFALALNACAQVSPPVRAGIDVPRTAADSIRSAILRGAEGFERGDPALILAHYAPDVLLSFPGVPDMDHGTLARSYAELRLRPASIRARTVPSIDEILVDGSLAIVRVRWTTTITDTARGDTSERRLKDLQVWRRESNGIWRFIRGMHFREPEAVPSR